MKKYFFPKEGRTIEAKNEKEALEILNKKENVKTDKKLVSIWKSKSK